MRLSVVGSVIIALSSLFRKGIVYFRGMTQEREYACSIGKHLLRIGVTIEFEETDSYRERRGMARGVNVVDGLKFCLKHDSSRGEGGGEKNVKQRDLRKARDRGEWDGMRWIKGIVHF